MDFVLGIATGLLVGGRVIIAQYTGNGKTEEVKDTILTMFLFIVILSLVLTVVMLLICGITFIFGYNTVSVVLNGMGDSKTPLIFVVISTVINIIQDLILVGAFGKGAFGAALATVTAQGISCFLGIMYLKRKELLPDF